MSATMIEDVGIQQHPAELSGASNDPKKRIFDLVLVKDESIVVLDLAHKRAYLQVLRRFRKVEAPRRNTTSILRVCKQGREEGTDILYGRNTFVAEPSLFKDYFICGTAWEITLGKDNSPYPFAGIGLANTAKIKSARFELPGNTGSGAQNVPSHAQLLDFLCTELSSLQKLTLVAKTGSCVSEAIPYGAMVNDTRIEGLQTVSSRELLIATVRRTNYHPVLRTAVWRKESGSDCTRVTEVTDWQPYSAYRISTVNGKFVVDLVANGHQPKLMGGSEIKTTYCRMTYESEDIVLNSLALRRACWDDLPGFSTFPTVFKLDASAPSSEIDPEEVQTWPGIDQYDPCSDHDLQKRNVRVLEE